MPTHQFETHAPVALLVEIGKGSVSVHTTATTETTVTVEGRDAERVQVFQDGPEITVKAPTRTGFLGGESALHVQVALPEGSDVETRTGSADVSVTGEVRDLGVRTGSGDVVVAGVVGDAVVKSGSGDVRVEAVQGSLQVKSGSGDLRVGRVAGLLTVSTGSGDVHVDDASAGAAVKTGSGGLSLGRAEGEFSLVTGSGSLQVASTAGGRFDVKGASGDVRIGVRPGVPVWTDISSLSGRVRSTLESAGEPEPGAAHVEVRAVTVSGDVLLQHAE